MLEHISAALYEYENNNNAKRRLDVIFRSNNIDVPVVNLRPEKLLYNHDNSRIRVELEAHPKFSNVMKDPTSSESQQVLEQLLRQTPAYETIKEEVKEFKQREPGTVSVDGRVINGNTRLAAIRELGWDGFDAGVLPETATDSDFKEIELGLQMVDFTKQKYSFINRLRLFEGLLETKPLEEICRLMGWKTNKTKEYDKFKLILSLVNDYAAQGVPKLFFDTKEEYLKNLAEKIQTYSAAGKTEEIVKIKNYRLAGMLCGNTKDEVREIETNFISKYLEPRLENSPLAVQIMETANTPTKATEGGDLFGATHLENFGFVGEIIARSNKEASSAADDSALNELRAAFRLAGDDAVQDKKRTNLRAAPISMLTKVRSDTNSIRVKIKEIMLKGDLSTIDKTTFEEGLKKLRLEIDTLETEFSAFYDEI